MTTPEQAMSECSTCGYRWRTGHHGGHSCVEHMTATIARLTAELESLQEGYGQQLAANVRLTADLAASRAEVEALRLALRKVLDARDEEAKARFSYENARDNFTSGAALESRRHQRAMLAASSAEKEARLLLAPPRQGSAINAARAGSAKP